MTQIQDEGGSPTPNTTSGVAAEADGALRGNQLFQALLAREESRVEEVKEEEEVVEEVPIEQPVEVPPKEEETEAEPDDGEDQPEEEESTQPEEEEVLSHTPDEVEKEEEPQRVPLKRLNKEVARRKDLEERLKRAQARLAEKDATPPQPVTTPVDTIPEVDTPQALARLEEETEDAVDYLEDRLNDQPDSVDDEGREVYTLEGQGQYTRKQMGGMLINARRKLRREIPQKRQFLQQAHTRREQAHERHPWLEDNTSDEYQTFQAIQSSRPWINKNDPAGDLLIAAAVEGLKVINGRGHAKAPAKSVAKKKAIAPPVDTTSAAPKRVATGGRRAKRLASEQKILAKGKLEGKDLRQVFLQRELEKE